MNKNTLMALSLGIGAVWLWMRNQQGSAPPAAAGSGSAGSGSGSETTPPPPPRLVDQLKAEAGVDLANADEWNFFLSRIANRDFVATDIFHRAFFPDGRPPLVTFTGSPNLPTTPGLERFGAEEFLRRAKEAGATGLDGFRRITAARRSR